MNRRGFFALLATAIFGRKLRLAPPPVPSDIGIRFVRSYTPQGLAMDRIDVLAYGFSRLAPEYGVRILS